MSTNDLYFKPSSKTKGYFFSFEWHNNPKDPNYSVPENVTFEGVKTNHDEKSKKDYLKVIVSVSKRDSDYGQPVAQWYRDFVGGCAEAEDSACTPYMIHTGTGSNDPHKLNFAIRGTLKIGKDEASAQAFEVCFGQGHGNGNNWHFCSKDLHAFEKNKGGFLDKPGGSGERYCILQTGSNDTFMVGLASEAGYQENDFELSMDQKHSMLKGPIEKMKFELTDHCISRGQAFVGVKTSVKDGKGMITVLAGRHKTTAVADWFNGIVEKGTALLGAGASVGCSSVSTAPDELNFAIKGTLTITVGSEDIKITDFMVAQGSYGLLFMNNWWLGGPLMKGYDVPVLGGIVGQVYNVIKAKVVGWYPVPLAHYEMKMIVGHLNGDELIIEA